jgi:hypothetical protein
MFCALGLVLPALPAEVAVRLLLALHSLSEVCTKVDASVALPDTTNTTSTTGEEEKKKPIAAKRVSTSQMVMALIAQCCGRLLRGDAVTDTERALQPWLGSSLFAGGLSSFGAASASAQQSELTNLKPLLQESVLKVLTYFSLSL